MPLKMYREADSSAPLARIGHMVAIAAGKGGVGKSTLSTHLALALKGLGYSVGLLDCDVYGPSVRRMLPEDRLPSQKDKVLVPALCRGIKMLSMAYFRREGEAAAVRAPIANGVVSQFLTGTAWGELDFLLVDFPPGTGDIQLTLAQRANLSGAVMVTTPQQVAVMDVRKATHLFDQVQVPLLGLVENMSYLQTGDTRTYPFGRGGGEALATELGTPLLGSIPLDPELCSCCDEGKSLFDVAPDGETAQQLIAVAKALVQQVSALEQGGCLTDFELKWRQMAEQS